MDKRKFSLFLLWIFLGGVLSVFSQDTNVEPEAVLVPEAQDKLMIEIDAVMAEELKQVSPEWENSLFTEGNLILIKTRVRKALPDGTEGLSEGSRKALIRKSVKEAIYGSMKSVVLKESETLLLENIETLSLDWREHMLANQNFGVVLQQALGELNIKFLNLPQKERDAVIKENLKKEIIRLKQSIITMDAEKSLIEAVNMWPEAMRTNLETLQLKTVSQLLVKSVLQKTTPEQPRKEIGLIIQKEVEVSLLQLAEKLAGEKIIEVIARESGGMGPGLTDSLVINEKMFKEIISEVKKTVLNNTAGNDPLLFYKAASEKATGIVQKILIRERDKYRGECLQAAMPEETAFDPDKYWLLFPVSEKNLKEKEVFPYVDEIYYLCNAVAKNSIASCDRITGQGREGHKEDCQSFALLYLKAMPDIVGGVYPEETMKEILALKTSANAEKGAVEPMIRAMAEKNIARCDPLKGKHDDVYRVCQSVIKKDTKACAGAAFPAACEQVALSLASLLYNDSSSLNKILDEDIVMPFVLLSRLQFDKNTCAAYYENVIKKRACYNMYQYKPKTETEPEMKKEVMQGEKKQKEK